MPLFLFYSIVLLVGYFNHLTIVVGKQLEYFIKKTSASTN